MEWLDETTPDDGRWLDGELSRDVGGTAEPAPASDLDEVQRLLRRLRHLQARTEHVKKAAKAERENVSAWERRELETLGEARQRIEETLEGWTRATYELDKIQTHKFPVGSLSLRKRPPSTELTGSEDHVVELLRVQGLESFVRTTRAVDKAALRSMCKPGEVATGVEAPEGMEARLAVLETPVAETGEIKSVVVPGAVFFVPRDGAEGMTFKAKPE